MATAVTLAQAREVIPTILLDDDLQRVVDVAINEVDRYAPDAPEPNRIEAALRMAAWQIESPRGGYRRIEDGSLTLEYTAVGNMLTNSGAATLLAQYRVRTLGVPE